MLKDILKELLKMTIEPYNYNDEPSGRVDTLAMALDKCERLEKQLKIAVEALTVYKESFIGNGKNSVILENGTILEYNPKIAEKALNDIKELEK